MNNLKLVKINSDYCDFLRQFDSKVIYNFGQKELRPFVGVLFEIEAGKFKYFAPLSSPKPKHKNLSNSAMDLLKIDGGKLGVVNINNMIPVSDKNYFNISFSAPTSNDHDEKYRLLMINQLNWLNKTNNKELLLKKANKIYELYKAKKLYPQLMERCCNFDILEQKCKEYNK